MKKWLAAFVVALITAIPADNHTNVEQTTFDVSIRETEILFKQAKMIAPVKAAEEIDVLHNLVYVIDF